MLALAQFYIIKFRPLYKAILTRIVYAERRVKIGKGFRTDSVPRLIVDKGAKLVIGDNVEFRRNIEIRAHGKSEIIIGDNVRLDRGIRILSANKASIHINDKVRIGLYTVLNGGDSITIGTKSLVSGFCYLQTSMHGYRNPERSIQDQGYDHAPVTLQEDVWLGTHVVVMPGVTIGKGGVAGSNAVITKDVLGGDIVGGIPAKTLKTR